MIKLYDNGVYLLNGTDIVEDNGQAEAQIQAKCGEVPSKEQASEGTIAYSILKAHNTSGGMDNLQIKFDKLTSHDITFVGIIQTARASGLDKFPVPYVLTNCHNSLCAVGGTINEDDHMFGLSCAKRYGGMYVPPHQAVIHQFAREMLAEGGKMILGSDSHTRYGALGTMAMGEGGPELVKQLLERTYDIPMPGVIGIYLDGEPMPGVGPQDVALAIIGAVFNNGYVKNKVMEFVGPGVSKLSADYRIGIDVMTTETTCLSSIWRTDDKIKEFYEIHGRAGAYKELNPAAVTYYDGMVYVDLSKIQPMIAMPFHPSNVYTIHELQDNLMDILDDCEKKNENINPYMAEADFDEKAFDMIGPNTPRDVKDAWMEAAKDVNANGMGIKKNGMLSHISQMMVQRLNKQLKGDGDADNIDILGNTTESAIQATSQALYDLDHPREYVPKSIEVQRACMKEREFYVAFLEKLEKLKVSW